MHQKTPQAAKKPCHFCKNCVVGGCAVFVRKRAHPCVLHRVLLFWEALVVQEYGKCTSFCSSMQSKAVWNGIRYLAGGKKE